MGLQRSLLKILRKIGASAKNWKFGVARAASHLHKWRNGSRFLGEWQMIPANAANNKAEKKKIACRNKLIAEFNSILWTVGYQPNVIWPRFSVSLDRKRFRMKLLDRLACLSFRRATHSVCCRGACGSDWAQLLIKGAHLAEYRWPTFPIMFL